MSEWEKGLIAAQLRAQMDPHEVMNQVRERRAEERAAVGLAEALTNPKMPWNHDFLPDPLTPSACVVEGLHPAWHRDHEPPTT
jgi:hypothetical protein